VDDWDVMGMRSTVSWSIEMNDVVVPDEWIIGGPGDWVIKDPRTFTLAYVANHLGTAQGVFDFVCDYIKERPHIASDPVTLVAIGDISSTLEVTRAALYTAARLWEQGDDPDHAELESMRVLHVAKAAALKVANQAFDILGARLGYRVFPLDRALRDIRMFTLHFRDNLYMQTVGSAVLGTPFSAKGARSGSSPGRDDPHRGNLDAIG
jgi:alkylation response protein AidB-like acyl-CoA dehydrogenase